MHPRTWLMSVSHFETTCVMCAQKAHNKKKLKFSWKCFRNFFQKYFGNFFENYVQSNRWKYLPFIGQWQKYLILKKFTVSRTTKCIKIIKGERCASLIHTVRTFCNRKEHVKNSNLWVTYSKSTKVFKEKFTINWSQEFINCDCLGFIQKLR